MLMLIIQLSQNFSAFKVKDRDKNKSNKLKYSHIDDGNLLEKDNIISTKIEDLENTGSNALPVYDDRYIKTKQEYTVIKFLLTFVA